MKYTEGNFYLGVKRGRGLKIVSAGNTRESVLKKLQFLDRNGGGTIKKLFKFEDNQEKDYIFVQEPDMTISLKEASSNK